MRHLFVFAILLGGCLPGFGNTDSSVEGEEGDGDGDGDGDIDRDDCKIENDSIGQEDVVLALGSRTVTFSDWVGKADSPGEFVGFTLAVSNDSTVSYVVKAGGEQHTGSATTWLHPAGADGGPNAPGISHIDMCDGNGDGGGGDGGGDDGGGDGGGDGGPIIL
jgi:hypothetical protein